MLSPATSFSVFVILPADLAWAYMKSPKNKSNRDRQGIAKEFRGCLLVLNRVYDLVKRHREVGLKREKRVLKRLGEIDDSIQIIARELARQASEAGH